MRRGTRQSWRAQERLWRELAPLVKPCTCPTIGQCAARGCRHCLEVMRSNPNRRSQPTCMVAGSPPCEENT